jgi:hypothetical protein
LGAPAHKRYERKVDEFCDKIGLIRELLVAALRLAQIIVRVIHGMKIPQHRYKANAIVVCSIQQMSEVVPELQK